MVNFDTLKNYIILRVTLLPSLFLAVLQGQLLILKKFFPLVMLNCISQSPKTVESLEIEIQQSQNFEQ